MRRLCGALAELGRSLGDALLDRRCSGCGGEAPARRDVCDACDARIDRTGVVLCLACLHGGGAPAADGGCPRHGAGRLLVAGPRFEPPLDAIVRAFKYEGAWRLGAWLGALLPEPPGLDGPLRREYLLVPVPLHPARRARRGFDQAALLAREASHRWGIPVADPLRRIRDQEPQARLDPVARRAGMAGAFRCPDPSLISDRPLLLIDDVATTGATLLAATAALETAGSAWVLALTCAHGGADGAAEPAAQAQVAPDQADVLGSRARQGRAAPERLHP